MSLRVKILLFVTLAMLAGGLFYLRLLSRRIQFENPLRREESVLTRLSEDVLQSSNPSQAITLYFPSYDRGQLLPESRSLALAASDPDRIRQILLALIEGSRSGANPPLPPETTVRAVFLAADGTAYLDLSSEAQSSTSPGIRGENLAVYSLVDSLAANIPSVKSIKILIQGQEVETLSGHVDLTNNFVADVSYAAPTPAR
jgi:spore germination protein GerM